MLFAVGYQMRSEEEESMVDIIKDYAGHVGEVYFPWLSQPSGRAALTSRRGYVNWQGQSRLESDLVALRRLGIKLDLLFNANCYGQYAASRHLANTVCSVIDHLGEVVGGVDIVTTASPVIAWVLKNNYPEIEVRASVNMRIGTVQGMSYMADLFDSYCVQRDYNRDLERLAALRAWAKENGKKLSLLVNSGCLRFCPNQVFHDNLVAHEQEVDEMANIPDWTSLGHLCWRYFRYEEHWPAFLQSTWIRPEDLHHYEGLCDIFKLATRMHAYPAMVIDAYVKGRFHGNLPNLFEPGFGPAFAPRIIDNSKFPADWFAITTSCRWNCHECDYCRRVLREVVQEVIQEPAG